VDRVHKQNEMIARSLQTVAETAEVGDEITKELQRNREKIESSRAKVCKHLKNLGIYIYTHILF
jgi:hypothetical protein